MINPNRYKALLGVGGKAVIWSDCMGVAVSVVQPNPLVFNAPIQAIRYAAAGLPKFRPGLR